MSKRLDFKTQKRFWFNSSILLLGLLLTGCGIYIPHTPDIPLIKEKNELRVDGGISLIVPSINGTISYGLTDKVAVQAFGSIDGDNKYLVTGAIGLFKYIPTLNLSSELYVGFGQGYTSAFNDANPGNAYGNYQMYFIQGNFGARSIKFKFVEVAAGLKVGLLNTHLTDANYFDRYPNYLNYSNITPPPYVNPFYNDLSVFAEPIISIKLGGDRLMFNFKPSWCLVNNISSDRMISFWPFGSLGLSLNYRF